MSRRTPRRDSVYVIYAAEHEGKVYIGLTRRGSTTPTAAVKARWRRHISRARHEQREWQLYLYIQQGAWEGWQHRVLETVRGRAEAYARERELVLQIQPALNDQYCG